MSCLSRPESGNFDKPYGFSEQSWVLMVSVGSLDLSGAYYHMPRLLLWMHSAQGCWSGAEESGKNRRE